MVSYLSQEEVSVKEIIDVVESLQIPHAWKVTVVVPKKREQKENNVRLYAKMTPEMRLYQTATESNIVESVFPYLPQQTMTLSEEKLLRVIQRMTNPKIDAASQEFCYEVIDFSSWCTNHRFELCAGVFSQYG